jgi:hypothetical protein
MTGPRNYSGAPSRPAPGTLGSSATTPSFSSKYGGTMTGPRNYSGAPSRSAPNVADNLGNYAQLLFAQHRDDEAVKFIDQALAQSNVSASLRLELAFNLYAHVLARRQEAMQQLVSLLSAGERSETWDFSPNLDRAKQDGDRRFLLLVALADVIRGTTPIEDLGQFDEWWNSPE